MTRPILLAVIFIVSLLVATLANTEGTPPCVVDAEAIGNFDWSPNGHTIAFSSNCGILLLDEALEELTGILALDNIVNVGVVAYNHDGSLLAASLAHSEAGITVWDTFTGSTIQTIPNQFSTMPIAWHPSQDIFVFGYDGEMLFYDMQSSMVVFQFTPSHSDEIMGNYPTLACWSPRGSYVLLSFMYAPRYLITFPAWETAQGNMASYYGGACTPDATLLGGLGGGIQDLLTNTRTVPNVECEGISVAWRTNGAEEHAVNCRDQTVRVYDRAAQLLFTLEGSHTGRSFIQSARSIEYSPDGSRLVALGNDGVARLWDTSNYELITRVNVADIANLALE